MTARQTVKGRKADAEGSAVPKKAEDVEALRQFRSRARLEANLDYQLRERVRRAEEGDTREAFELLREFAEIAHDWNMKEIRMGDLRGIPMGDVPRPLVEYLARCAMQLVAEVDPAVKAAKALNLNHGRPGRPTGAFSAEFRIRVAEFVRRLVADVSREEAVQAAALECPIGARRVEWGIRAKPITESGVSRSLNPVQADHPLRSMPISDSGGKPISFQA